MPYIKTLFLVSLFAVASTLHAQTYPTKPVRILAASVGAGADFFSRYLGQRLTERWDKTIIVDNRPGASGTMAAAIGAKASPDGYTLLMGEGASLANAVSTYEHLPYDPLKDFASITLVARAPLILVAHPSVPATTLRQFIELAKQRPQPFNYASGGDSTASHLTTALFLKMTGITMVHVPYKGAGAALPAVISGESQFSSLSATAAVPQVKAGRLKAFAVTGKMRFAALPNVPTGAEAGIPGFESEVWFGLLSPAKTPNALVRKVHDDVVEILARPDTRTVFETQGAEPSPTTPAQFHAWIENEIRKWQAVIKTLPRQGDATHS